MIRAQSSAAPVTSIIVKRVPMTNTEKQHA
jgi:hypothetical protein